MTSLQLDKVFSGAIPQLYETHLVPLIFDPYAADLAHTVSALSPPPARVLEIAAGTGVVTRALAAALPDTVPIVATDLNQAMLDQGAAIGTKRPVEWRQADAMQLPFDDGAFDAVVCQFGVMFFPDKPQAFAQARRVLRPGGVFIFNVWDTLADNEFAHVISTAVASVFPDDPPRFLARTPYAYNDRAVIQRDLSGGGFTAAAHMRTLAVRSWAASPRIPAVAFCQGTPLRNEIEARDPTRLTEATEAAAEAVAARFGNGPVEAKIQAVVVTVAR